MFGRKFLINLTIVLVVLGIAGLAVLSLSRHENALQARYIAEAEEMSGQEQPWIVAYVHREAFDTLDIIVKHPNQRIEHLLVGHRQYERFSKLKSGDMISFLFAENQNFDSEHIHSPISAASFLIPATVN